MIAIGVLGAGICAGCTHEVDPIGTWRIDVTDTGQTCSANYVLPRVDIVVVDGADGPALADNNRTLASGTVRCDAHECVMSANVIVQFDYPKLSSDTFDWGLTLLPDDSITGDGTVTFDAELEQIFCMTTVTGRGVVVRPQP